VIYLCLDNLGECLRHFQFRPKTSGGASFDCLNCPSRIFSTAPPSPEKPRAVCVFLSAGAFRKCPENGPFGRRWLAVVPLAACYKAPLVLTQAEGSLAVSVSNHCLVAAGGSCTARQAVGTPHLHASLQQTGGRTSACLRGGRAGPGHTPLSTSC
jgi:hypothetical protein